MIDDVLDLLRKKSRVDRVADGAVTRHGEIQLEMTVIVPGQRADPVSVADPGRAQRVREAPHAPERARVGRAMEGIVGGHGDDLAVAVHAIGELHDARDRQRPVHHQSGQHHSAPLRVAVLMRR